MQSPDVRMVTEAAQAVKINAATAPLKATDVAHNQRLDDLEVLGGLNPGNVNDATTASLIRNQESDTHSELSAAVGYVNATGDGITDDTAAFNAAIAEAGGKLRRVRAGTYLLNNVIINGKANLLLDEGAVLIHKPDAGSGAMFNFRPTATRFKLRGGIIDGNRASQTGRPYIFIGALQSGKSFDVEDVEFTGTVASIAYVSEFGGYLNFSRNKVLDQSQHSGNGSDFTTVVTVVSGQPGVKGFIRTNENYCYWGGVPARAGSNPGGFFVNTTTIGGDDSNGNLTTWEADGNYFYGYGQHDSLNDISPLHTYPTIQGARFTGNYFEKSGFCAVSAKSVQDFVFMGNVIVDGMVSAKNTASEGAISYVPGYKAGTFKRHKAIISGNIVKNPGGQVGIGQNALSVHGIPTSTAGDIVVSDNIFDCDGAGINAQYAGDMDITNNRITTRAGGSAGTGTGIRFSHMTGDVGIRGNTITTENGDGINAITGANEANFHLSDNVINQKSASRYGMILRGMKFLKLTGNTIDNPAGPAVNVQADAAGNKISHLVYDSSNTAIRGEVSINWPDVTKFEGSIPDIGIPAVSAGAAAGSGATASVSAESTDEAGIITITTGTGTVAGGLATITYGTPLRGKPKAVILTPANAAAAGLVAYVNSSTLITGSFAISVTGTAPTVSTAHQWHYQVIP